MSLYRFRCNECGKDTDKFLPMIDRNLPQECECGGRLERLMSTPNVLVPVTGREQVLKTLNKEEGGDHLPTVPSDRPRMEAALARGLDQRRPTAVGRGFAQAFDTRRASKLEATEAASV